MPNYITAEGPSSELATGFLGAVCERATGWTYPAPHEPARFVPFDPEITARAMDSAAWYGRFAAFLSNKARKYEAQRAELREQLETARKALDRIRLHNDSYVSHRIATEALDLIGAGRFDRKCPHCDFVTEYPLMFENHVKYGHGAGQKGGK